jgi:hypothetical protein
MTTGHRPMNLPILFLVCIVGLLMTKGLAMMLGVHWIFVVLGAGILFSLIVIADKYFYGTEV